ncbi:hypothetical protein J2S75_002369 [Ancylobacter polymorphus]|uniref:Uncharacterized protein n=1 Tax=Ancylobacter polymorphus TaxID=223390 RepID=A0ABU0BFT4_9HYPH|nr:hypothetical protein [Ancylobacter polymorphus]
MSAELAESCALRGSASRRCRTGGLVGTRFPFIVG